MVFSYSSYSISCKVRNIPRIDGEVMAMPMLGDSTGGEGPEGRDLATGETRSLEGEILQPEKQGLWREGSCNQRNKVSGNGSLVRRWP